MKLNQCAMQEAPEEGNCTDDIIVIGAEIKRASTWEWAARMDQKTQPRLWGLNDGGDEVAAARGLFQEGGPRPTYSHYPSSILHFPLLLPFFFLSTHPEISLMNSKSELISSLPDLYFLHLTREFWM